MAKNGLSTHPAIQAFGHAWDFWTTFTWIKTNDIVIAQYVRTDAEQRWPSIKCPSSYYAAFAIQMVHESYCVAGNSHDDPCDVWIQVWKDLRHQAGLGKVRTIGYPSLGAQPADIPSTVWQIAETQDEPTSLELPRDIRWNEIMFDATDVITVFQRPKSQKLPASRNETEQIVKDLIAECRNVRDFHKLANERCSSGRRISRTLVNEFRSQLGYSPPKGRPARSK